jgi:hypothetical protein
MQRVLNTGQNEPMSEVEEIEEPEAEVEPEVEPEVEAQGDPGDEQPPEPDEELAPEDPEQDDQGEPEEEETPEEGDDQPDPSAEAHEDEFYLGRYKSREEAEKGWLEKEQFISRQGDELAQLRQEMAEMRGYVQGATQRPAVEGEFEQWAEQHIVVGDGWGGAHEALDAALQSGDPSYVDGYIEVWKEHDPFEAARFRTMVDNQIAQAQQVAQAQNQPPPPQAVLNGVWLSMADEYEDLRDPEVAAQVGAVLKSNAALRGAATSGNPDVIRDAIAMARDGVRLQGARPGNGTPRKVKSSDAERTAQAKLDASVTTGDSAPDRSGSTPEVPPELQDMMGAIQRGEPGFPRLRE